LAPAPAGHPLTLAESLKLKQYGTQPPREHTPLIRPCLILDDLSHSRLFQSKFFINLCLRNRHVCHDPQVGLNIIVATQSVKAGLPRVLRGNCNLWVLFPTRDRSIIRQDIWPEVSGRITRQAFEDLFHYCSQGEHTYMVVDQTQADPRKIFRKTFQGPFVHIQDDTDSSSTQTSRM
jgi:hypothetical protein